MTARISIDGNLVADPDFGVGDSGKSWAHLRVASHERMRRDGEWVSTDPEFYNVTLFGAAAETAANELNKGDRVSIEGRPQLETFDRRDGTAGAAIKVYARKALKIDDSVSAERSAADRDVNNGEPVVRIDDPDNPLGPPAYEGPASAAHTRLTPGIYTASTFGDGITTFEATETAPIRVRVTGTCLLHRHRPGRDEPRTGHRREPTDPSHRGEHRGGRGRPDRSGTAQDVEGQRVPLVNRHDQLEPAEGHGRAHPRRPGQ